MGRPTIDLLRADRIVCEVLSRDVRVTHAELGAALGIGKDRVGRLLRRLMVYGSPETKSFIQKRSEETGVPWWGRKEVKPEEVVAEIRLLAGKLGRVPRMKDAGSSLINSAIKAFGSWGAAVRAAGLRSKRYGLPRDPWLRREALLEYLREAARVLGHAPTAEEYTRVAKEAGLPRDPGAYRKFFGSWREALQQAGLLKPEDDPVRREVERLLSLGRPFVSVKEIECASPSVREAVKKALAENGVTVLRASREMAERLSAAAAAGFPEVPGRERGRLFAMRLASGEACVSIAADAGLSHEWVRQLVRKYCDAVGTGKTDSQIRRRNRLSRMRKASGRGGIVRGRDGAAEPGKTSGAAVACKAPGV